MSREVRTSFHQRITLKTGIINKQKKNQIKVLEFRTEMKKIQLSSS